MECYTCLRHVTDLLSDGKTPYERRFGQPFNGPIIPFGSLVERSVPCHTATCIQTAHVFARTRATRMPCWSMKPAHTVHFTIPYPCRETARGRLAAEGSPTSLVQSLASRSSIAVVCGGPISCTCVLCAFRRPRPRHWAPFPLSSLSDTTVLWAAMLGKRWRLVAGCNLRLFLHCFMWAGTVQHVSHVHSHWCPVTVHHDSNCFPVVPLCCPLLASDHTLCSCTVHLFASLPLCYSSQPPLASCRWFSPLVNHV